MDPITVETIFQMTTTQFITLIAFLVVNTTAIAASWHRFGARITKIESDALQTRQDIMDLKQKNTSTAHTQLRKEHDEHVINAHRSAMITDKKLDDIKDAVNKIASTMETHLEIHKDRENNQRRKPIDRSKE
ncbi:MAG: hypothetical protein IH597_14905 [Bacteroidales bacterium]|nr:hypothetical protein [Bacteroidales bacterium]